MYTNFIVIIILLMTIIFTVNNEVVFKNDDEKSSSGRSRGEEKNFSPNNNRTGKNLLNWINSFGDSNTDPYLAKSNAACLEGDLAECFKAKALSSLDDFFTKQSYELNPNAKIIRMPEEQLRRLHDEPYEYSNFPKTEEPEWDQFVKFLMRKVERFLKSAAIEVDVTDDITENGRYAPRFIDEIASELETIEDKKAGFFKKFKIKKLLIPLLIMVKLFKLKLLLFLPLILGLASFKKFLGFLAIVIPGLIGFFKLCKPDLNQSYGNFGHSSFYHRPPHHHQFAPHHEYEYRNTEQPSSIQYLFENNNNEDPTFYQQQASASQQSSSIAFRDDPHKLAYNGYQEQRKNK